MIRKDCKTTIPAVAMDGLLSSPGGASSQGAHGPQPLPKVTVSISCSTVNKTSTKIHKTTTKRQNADKRHNCECCLDVGGVWGAFHISVPGARCLMIPQCLNFITDTFLQTYGRKHRY